jgi:uncharacterized membrane protein
MNRHAIGPLLMATRTFPLPKPLRIVRNHPRLIVAAALGVIVALVLPSSLRLSTRLLIGWDIGAVCYLAAAVALVQDFDLKRVQRRAEQYDERGLLILILTVVAAIASLAAIVVELGATRAANVNDRLALLLAAGTTLLSWALIHTIFAFHYAHRFYRGPGNRGSGLIFPQTEHPNYWDFVYFSFVIGMTFQVSDVQVTRTPLRRVVMVQGVVSFFFSVAILALTVNLGSNLI